jgi:hypothetical protein
MALMSINAFHGTSTEAAVLINAHGFNESAKRTEWLGRGIYFFVDGVTDPQANAREWARAQAWDSKSKSFKYSHGAVVHAKFLLESDRILDLTDLNGLRRFIDLKERLLSLIIKKFDTDSVRRKEQTCYVFNMFVDIFKSHAVKQNLYIKPHVERALDLHINIPNTTVLCLRKDAVKIETQTVFEEELKNE